MNNLINHYRANPSALQELDKNMVAISAFLHKLRLEMIADQSLFDDCKLALTSINKLFSDASMEPIFPCPTEATVETVISSVYEYIWDYIDNRRP